MIFLGTVRSWFAPPAPTQPQPRAPVAPLTLDASLSVLTPSAPGPSQQRYSDAQYAASRAQEARKQHVMNRICAVNNAAAEDVIDRRGTVRRAPKPSRPAAPLTAGELHDAVNLAEIAYAVENAHDPRQ